MATNVHTSPGYDIPQLSPECQAVCFIGSGALGSKIAGYWAGCPSLFPTLSKWHPTLLVYLAKNFGVIFDSSRPHIPVPLCEQILLMVKVHSEPGCFSPPPPQEASSKHHHLSINVLDNLLTGSLGFTPTPS